MAHQEFPSHPDLSRPAYKNPSTCGGAPAEIFPGKVVLVAGARVCSRSRRLDPRAARRVEVVPLRRVESEGEPAFGHALRTGEPDDDARALHGAVCEGVGAQRLDEINGS